jgi:hypothetical protein
MSDIQCGWCLQTVPAGTEHSCFDAKKVADHRNAERSVLYAARAWWDVRGGPYEVERAHAEVALKATVAKLVALEGGA